MCDQKAVGPRRGVETMETCANSNIRACVGRMLILNAARRLVQRIPRTISLICTTLSLLLGFLVYYLWMGLDPVDAIYLTVVTISTVGYGDISPSQVLTAIRTWDPPMCIR